MTLTEWGVLTLFFALLTLFFALLILSLIGVARALWIGRYFPDDPGRRWESGWLGAFSLFGLLGGCVGLAGLLAPLIDSSSLAFAAVLILNLLAQPILLLLCFTSLRKILSGLRGRICYAGVEIPDAEWQQWSADLRRWAPWYGILQGVGLLVFGWLSFVLFAPLL
jgi:hypothetical protein